MSSKKKLIENFVSLLTVQGLNYVLPLLTLPFLVRKLGPDNYGLTAFSLAFIQLLVILTDYGFNLSATREISIKRNDKTQLGKIFSTVISIKLILALFSFAFLFLVVTFFDKFQKDSLLYFYTFSIVIGNVLFPVWFFQGMEKMKYITILNIISKSFYTLAIFTLIDNKEDYLWVNLLNGLSIIIIGLISLNLIYRVFGIKYTIPTIADIISQLKEGWLLFLSTAAVSLYTVSNTFFLGLFANNTIVGYYSGAEKVINAFNGIIAPLSQTIYPHVNRLASESRKKTIIFLSRIFKLVSASTLVVSVVVFIFAEEIIFIILGNGYYHSIEVLKILSILPFLIGTSNILGIQTMLTFNYKKDFSRVLIITSFINFVLTLILVPIFEHKGSAYSVLLSELTVSVFMYVFLYCKGINLLGGK